MTRQSDRETERKRMRQKERETERKTYLTREKKTNKLKKEKHKMIERKVGNKGVRVCLNI